MNLTFSVRAPPPGEGERDMYILIIIFYICWAKSPPHPPTTTHTRINMGWREEKNRPVWGEGGREPRGESGGQDLFPSPLSGFPYLNFFFPEASTAGHLYNIANKTGFLIWETLEADQESQVKRLTRSPR